MASATCSSVHAEVLLIALRSEATGTIRPKRSGSVSSSKNVAGYNVSCSRSSNRRCLVLCAAWHQRGDLIREMTGVVPTTLRPRRQTAFLGFVRQIYLVSPRNNAKSTGKLVEDLADWARDCGSRGSRATSASEKRAKTGMPFIHVPGRPLLYALLLSAPWSSLSSPSIVGLLSTLTDRATYGR